MCPIIPVRPGIVDPEFYEMLLLLITQRSLELIHRGVIHRGWGQTVTARNCWHYMPIDPVGDSIVQYLVALG